MFKHIKDIISNKNVSEDLRPKGMAKIIDMTPAYNPLDEFKNETNQ